MTIRRARMLVVLGLAAGVLAYLAATLLPAHHPQSHPATGQYTFTGASVQNYPHLANYNGLRTTWQVPFFADNGLVIARRGAPVHALKKTNPATIALLYERTSQVDLHNMQALYGLRPDQTPPGWWLVSAGSRLAHSIDARQQWIAVVDPQPFHRCQDVLVDGESMHVWAVRGQLLQVLRGYASSAVAHRRGALIEPHYSYRSDLSNCSVFGRAPSRRPWSLNLSSRCPRWHGQTWAEYLARHIAVLVRQQGWDGVFYDNMTEFVGSRLIDVDHDGQPDGGIIDGENVWGDGERALLAATRALLPGRPILVNGDLRIDGLAVGHEMEGFPTIPGTPLAAALDSYLYDSTHGAPLTLINPDSVTRLYPSWPAVQLAIGAALLGSGYAAYDFGWLEHGYPWWFDEYDDGAGSATTHPVSAGSRLIPVVHARRFHTGDVILLDGEAARVLRVLSTSLLVERGAAGSYPAWHGERTSVSTLAQRTMGSGYLGQPRGPVRLVPLGDWMHTDVPLQIDPGKNEAAAIGHLQKLPRATHGIIVRLSSRIHYLPNATAMTILALPARHGLRTLIFNARGPSGESLWLTAGRSSVPLVLRSTWHRYVLPIGGAAQIVIGAGRVGGTVEISGVRLLAGQAFVLRRDFTHGIVIVNPTDQTQVVPLEHAYRVLAGDQNPWANTGARLHFISIARYRAVILLRV